MQVLEVGKGGETMPSMPSKPSDPHWAGLARSSRSRRVPRWITGLKHDYLLLGIIVACVLLLSFQLVLIVLQPPWSGPATDWLRAVLVWPELVVIVAVSLWLSCKERQEAVAWWLFSGGVLCYAIARTWWTIDDVLIYHNHVPFPSLPDLFFVLQYPFYFLAVILIPFGEYWGSRLLAVLDALILMTAATAISWYFLLTPLFEASGLSPLAKAVSVGYPVADLFLLLALTLILLRPLRHDEDRPVVALVCVGVVCLIIADVGAIILILHPAHEYHTGSFPDFFWLASDLFIPIAAIVQVRVVQRAQAAEEAGEHRFDSTGWRSWLWLNEQDVKAALRLFLPLVAALLASGVILLRAAAQFSPGDGWERLVRPLAIAAALLFLVIVRQAVLFLDMARLRHVVAEARAEERALRDLDRRKDEFLSAVSHELRTPLTSLELFFTLLERRFGALAPREAADESTASLDDGRESGHAGDAGALRTALNYCQANVKRLVRLANDLVDDTRVLHGRLSLHMEPCDLSAIVLVAVEEQRSAEPDRAIHLELPDSGQPVPVCADADRIGQVVTNYLTNALKYSTQERPVTVCLEVVKGAGTEGAECPDFQAGRIGELARVAVQDEGIGVPSGEQRQIWERFHITEGSRIQSGSGISLGLGLHISKAIVEEHHGHVGLDSIPGKGSTFWFTLPLARPRPT